MPGVATHSVRTFKQGMFLLLPKENARKRSGEDLTTRINGHTVQCPDLFSTVLNYLALPTLLPIPRLHPIGATR
eukprot:m.357609 g.357609  ORF g.357609 m.357609 type:complete len:74 (+) comp16616_c1_seq4:1479-1700(+)